MLKPNAAYLLQLPDEKSRREEANPATAFSQWADSAARNRHSCIF
jgi:hypothetical protein